MAQRIKPSEQGFKSALQKLRHQAPPNNRQQSKKEHEHKKMLTFSPPTQTRTTTKRASSTPAQQHTARTEQQARPDHHVPVGKTLHAVDDCCLCAQTTNTAPAEPAAMRKSENKTLHGRVHVQCQREHKGHGGVHCAGRKGVGELERESDTIWNSTTNTHQCVLRNATHAQNDHEKGKKQRQKKRVGW